MNLDEDAVRGAVRSLQDQFLARSVSGADSRVTKYEHRLQEAFNFDRREAAIICELLVRNDQTPGELRSRAERMHHSTTSAKCNPLCSASPAASHRWSKSFRASPAPKNRATCTCSAASRPPPSQLPA